MIKSGNVTYRIRVSKATMIMRTFYEIWKCMAFHQTKESCPAIDTQLACVVSAAFSVKLPDDKLKWLVRKHIGPIIHVHVSVPTVNLKLWWQLNPHMPSHDMPDCSGDIYRLRWCHERMDLLTENEDASYGGPRCLHLNTATVLPDVSEGVH